MLREALHVTSSRTSHELLQRKWYITNHLIATVEHVIAIFADLQAKLKVEKLLRVDYIHGAFVRLPW